MITSLFALSFLLAQLNIKTTGCVIWKLLTGSLSWPLSLVKWSRKFSLGRYGLVSNLPLLSFMFSESSYPTSLSIHFLEIHSSHQHIKASHKAWRNLFGRLGLGKLLSPPTPALFKAEVSPSLFGTRWCACLGWRLMPGHLSSCGLQTPGWKVTLQSRGSPQPLAEILSQAWWPRPVISEFGRLRQEDRRFKTGLSNVARLSAT